MGSRESGSAIKAGKIAQPGQPEPVSCDPAGGVAGFAGAAHVRPLAIDDAPCFVLTPTSPTKAAHRSPWHRMPFRLSSTSSRGMRLRSSSFSIVNRGQSLEYEQQAPQELQAPIGRHACDLCGAILSAPVWRSSHVGPSRRYCCRGAERSERLLALRLALVTVDGDGAAFTSG